MTAPYTSAHEELHYINRAGWLRAAVLGANDGIVSVSSLIVGVAAADPNPVAILVAGGWRRRPSCGCDVDGSGRICFGQFAI